LDVIVAQCAAIFELFSREDETLLIRRDSLLILDLGFNIVDGVGVLDIEGDCFAREVLDKDLYHQQSLWQKQVADNVFVTTPTIFQGSRAAPNGSCGARGTTGAAATTEAGSMLFQSMAIG